MLEYLTKLKLLELCKIDIHIHVHVHVHKLSTGQITVAKFIWNTRVELFLELDTYVHASIQQNDELFNPVLHNMAASIEMLGLVTLTELLNEEGDFIQKHIAKFVVTACALQIYKCKLK